MATPMRGLLSKKTKGMRPIVITATQRDVSAYD
jgi:hypothetical protein